MNTWACLECGGFLRFGWVSRRGAVAQRNECDMHENEIGSIVIESAIAQVSEQRIRMLTFVA